MSYHGDDLFSSSDDFSCLQRVDDQSTEYWTSWRFSSCIMFAESLPFCSLFGLLVSRWLPSSRDNSKTTWVLQLTHSDLIQSHTKHQQSKVVPQLPSWSGLCGAKLDRIDTLWMWNLQAKHFSPNLTINSMFGFSVSMPCLWVTLEGGPPSRELAGMVRGRAWGTIFEEEECATPRRTK